MGEDGRRPLHGEDLIARFAPMGSDKIDRMIGKAREHEQDYGDGRLVLSVWWVERWGEESQDEALLRFGERKIVSGKWVWLARSAQIADAGFALQASPPAPDHYDISVGMVHDGNEHLLDTVERFVGAFGPRQRNPAF